MADAPVRYRSHDEDSIRWHAFAHRTGDIVISTRSKSGTTWMQMICALLVLRTPDLPRPLGELSPWLDWLGASDEEMLGQLAGQTHRRFIKTHTPLDGLPLHRDVIYIVVARDPLDMAVSLFHQGNNIDRARLASLTGNRSGSTDAERDGPELIEWLRSWIDWDGPHRDRLDSLPGVFWHLNDAWVRRDQPNIVLVHYRDLLDDLSEQMANLAAVLEIDIDRAEIERLSEAATFTEMKRRSELLAPDPKRILRNRSAFFRQGQVGAARRLLSPADLAVYDLRVASLAAPGLADWLHRGS